MKKMWIVFMSLDMSASHQSGSMAFEDRQKDIMVKNEKHHHNNHIKTKLSGIILRRLGFSLESGSS